MMENLKIQPVFEKLSNKFLQKIMEYLPLANAFPGSDTYWETRYAAGGNSGAGSYDKLAEFKAGILNEFVDSKDIKSVIEFGCGDGNQLSLANYPSYLGFDVSETALEMCRNQFSGCRNRTFRKMRDYNSEKADLSVSLDVIYHLIEDEVYHEYMKTLFYSSSKFVIIYSSNSEDNSYIQCSHVKHRKFTRWVKNNAPEWKLVRHIPNQYPLRGMFKPGSFADFYIFEKRMNQKRRPEIGKRKQKKSVARQAAPA